MQRTVPGGDHFYTISEPERNDAIANLGYANEGIACFVLGAQPAGLTQLYRLFNPTNGDHFYTTDVAERDHAVANYGYTGEGVACTVLNSQGPGTTPLYRLFNAGNGDHFYTIDVAERDYAVVNYGYTGEGVACFVFGSQDPGTTPLYRLFNPGNSDHFYTTDAGERDTAVNSYGYVNEGIACFIYGSQTLGPIPFHRLFNSGNGDHFYTIDVVERDYAVANYGYIGEGVACFVFGSQDPGTTPLYRLFNPGNSDHFYTTDAGERDTAVNSYGYVNEGIACYVLAVQAPSTTALFRLFSTLTFAPANPTGVDQQVLNIFYYNCYMHDYFYLLGFKEVDGNFQQDNFGRGGRQSDRVDARAHPGAVVGTASMFTPIDGSAPTMNMGLVRATNRHTAFDSSVVFHEFMHGVTNRLVGGPLNDHALDAPQSGGMGEGWGDYNACTINGNTVVGAWVVNQPGGIRGFPYDNNFPDNFGDIGTGRYTEVHNIGEIWCATLMEMNRNIGATLGVQLVVDALKLSPANPSFLNMRDAILLALNDRLAAGTISSGQHLRTLRHIWTAFAHFGMGPDARSNGAQLSVIVTDFNLPTVTGIGDHFYTASAAERDNAIANFGYDDEGIACYMFAAQASGTTALFRLFNPQNGDHFYTISAPERDNAIANFGYQDEGIACYVFAAQASGTTPLFRLLKVA